MRKESNLTANLDWITVLVYVVLVILGWINIYAAVYNEDHKSIFDIQQRYGSQMLWIVAAFIIAIILLVMDTKFYTFFAYAIYGFTLLLLMAVLVVGREINGAKAWLNIGPFGIQPAEFAKVSTALVLAKYLSSYNTKITDIKNLMVVGLILFLPIALIALQPDAGSILVFMSFSLALYREGLPGSVLIFGALIAALFFLSLIVNTTSIIIGLVALGFIVYTIVTKLYKESILGFLAFGVITTIIYFIFKSAHKQLAVSYLLSISFIISGIGYLIYNFFKRLKLIIPFVVIISASILFTFSVDYVFHKALEPHQQKRMNILLGIEEDPLGMGYNVNQSLIAIGSGGFVGKGFLQGTQTKYNFVPEQSTDFIFCTVGEEWGFMGSFTVIALFVFLMARILIIAERQRSTFTRIYGYCVASILFFHFLINIGMAIGLLPVIGIPLPFFSYGGSSLWSFTTMLFVLLKFDLSRRELLM